MFFQGPMILSTVLVDDVSGHQSGSYLRSTSSSLDMSSVHLILNTNSLDNNPEDEEEQALNDTDDDLSLSQFNESLDTLILNMSTLDDDVKDEVGQTANHDDESLSLSKINCLLDEMAQTRAPVKQNPQDEISNPRKKYIYKIGNMAIEVSPSIYLSKIPKPDHEKTDQMTKHVMTNEAELDNKAESEAGSTADGIPTSSPSSSAGLTPATTDLDDISDTDSVALSIINSNPYPTGKSALESSQRLESTILSKVDALINDNQSYRDRILSAQISLVESNDLLLLYKAALKDSQARRAADNERNGMEIEKLRLEVEGRPGTRKVEAGCQGHVDGDGRMRLFAEGCMKARNSTR